MADRDDKIVDLARRRELELRYNGPIPEQHEATEARQRRRDLGTIGVLERQALTSIDAAERIDEELISLSGQEVTDLVRVQITAVRAERDRHITNAADALRRARDLRRKLGLPPHPMLMVARLTERST
jgi:hypothetical protein